MNGQRKVTDNQILEAISVLTKELAPMLPTYKEVACKLELQSRGGIFRRVKALEDKKLVVTYTRGMILTGKGKKEVKG